MKKSERTKNAFKGKQIRIPLIISKYLCLHLHTLNSTLSKIYLSADNGTLSRSRHMQVTQAVDVIASSSFIT